ncbi:MAG TPA: AI-2E family transporter [Bryobacteraceae bacterium]|nr:AI-2E family transporter [Bryobacteraceae bacterium]
MNQPAPVSALIPNLLTRKPSSPSLAILAVAACIALLYYGRIFLITMVISTIIAFLLDPLVTLFVRLRLPRPLSSLVVCGIALALLYLVGMGAWSELAGLVEDLPSYSGRIDAIADAVATRLDEVEKNTVQVLVPKRFRDNPAPPPAPNALQPPARGRRKTALPDQPATIPEVRIHQDPTPLLSFVYSYVRSIYDFILLASFVPFLVYFMLSWRDHLRRSFLYLFSGADRQVAHKTWESIADATRAYVIGNFILGTILAVASAAFFAYIHMPYWLLVGVLSGFLSLIPYIGLPLAILPAFAAGLTRYNNPAIYVLLAAVITAIHMIAVNLLYPKVVGSRLHLNPLVVTVSLMFWGTLWGGIGLILAVPIVAAVKAACDHINGLEAYGKFLGD